MCRQHSHHRCPHRGLCRVYCVRAEEAAGQYLKEEVLSGNIPYYGLAGPGEGSVEQPNFITGTLARVREIDERKCAFIIRLDEGLVG